MESRSPRFEKPSVETAPPPARHLPLLDMSGTLPRTAGCTCGWRTPRDASDSDTALAEHVALAKLTPDVDWESVDRMDGLRRELAQKAVAWVLADRICDDRSAALTLVEDEVDAREVQELEPDRAQLDKLERERVDFQIASQCADKCDDKFRQAARKLAAELERAPRAAAQALIDALKEGPEAALEFVAKLKEP